MGWVWGRGWGYLCQSKMLPQAIRAAVEMVAAVWGAVMGAAERAAEATAVAMAGAAMVVAATGAVREEEGTAAAAKAVATAAVVKAAETAADRIPRPHNSARPVALYWQSTGTPRRRCPVPPGGSLPLASVACPPAGRAVVARGAATAVAAMAEAAMVATTVVVG